VVLEGGEFDEVPVNLVVVEKIGEDGRYLFLADVVVGLVEDGAEFSVRMWMKASRSLSVLG